MRTENKEKLSPQSLILTLWNDDGQRYLEIQWPMS